MSVDVTAIMLTLNEADTIEQTLDSAFHTFVELSLLDGGSTDDTVAIAERWCEENGKDFVLTESSEREYLLEGVGMQRRRAENAGSYKYSLALDADVIVDVKNPEWFDKDFTHDGYVHTRVHPDGRVMGDYRLYNTEKDFRWRGLVHEEIRRPDGLHLSDATNVTEAPMVHRHQRQAAMETRTSAGMFQHLHDPAVGGNLGDNIKKQHYLLKRAVDNEVQSQFLSDAWKAYYYNNKATVADHWEDIHEEYDLPYFTERHEHEIRENEKYGIANWITEEYLDGEPIMGPETDTWFTYATKKVADFFGKNERVY